jgi:hypothetical protein
MGFGVIDFQENCGGMSKPYAAHPIVPQNLSMYTFKRWHFTAPSVFLYLGAANSSERVSSRASGFLHIQHFPGDVDDMVEL